MKMPVYVPYRRNFTDQQGDIIEIAFVAKNHGVIAHWVSPLGIVQVAKISHRGKLTLLQRPSSSPFRAPFHLYHGLLIVQAAEMLEGEDVNVVVDRRHLDPIAPQTLHEAKVALDELIGAVVSELDFLCMSEVERYTTPKLAVLKAMVDVCKERYVPRPIINLGMELKEGPITQVEQSIVEHIENGLYFADGEPFDSKDFVELGEYIRQKIEIVLVEMNGALEV